MSYVDSNVNAFLSVVVALMQQVFTVIVTEAVNKINTEVIKYIYNIICFFGESQEIQILYFMFLIF